MIKFCLDNRGYVYDIRDYANASFTYVVKFWVESLRPNSNCRTPKSMLQIAHCKPRSQANSVKVKHNLNKKRKKMWWSWKSKSCRAKKALTFERWSHETLLRRRHRFESSFALRRLPPPPPPPPPTLLLRRRRRLSLAPPTAWWSSASSRGGTTILRSSSTASSTPTPSPLATSTCRCSSMMRSRRSGSSEG